MSKRFVVLTFKKKMGSHAQARRRDGGALDRLRRARRAERCPMAGGRRLGPAGPRAQKAHQDTKKIFVFSHPSLSL